MRNSIVLLRHAVDMYAEIKERAQERVLATESANEEQMALRMSERVTAAAGLEVLAQTLRVAEAADRLLKNHDAALDDLERGEFLLDPGPTPPYRPSADDADRDEGGVEIDRAAHARAQIIWVANQVADFVLSDRESAITEAVDALARALPGTLEPLSRIGRDPVEDEPAPC